MVFDVTTGNVLLALLSWISGLVSKWVHSKFSVKP